MNTETKLPIHSATSLTEGSIIKLAGNELTIGSIKHYDRWTELVFTKHWWDSISEKWRSTYGCHPGFCFEVIQL